MNLGDKIVKLRKKNNMTQENLAEKLKVTRQTISKWELNETAPDIKEAKELASVFKVSINDLVYDRKIETESKPNQEELSGIIIYILKIAVFTALFLGIFSLIISVLNG